MSETKFTDKTLTIAGVASFTLSIFFLFPTFIAIPAAILIVATAGGLVFLKDKWIESGAD